ncbi:ATP-binding protein [Streptomyces gobiensis]|uniref:ATP-binding protein n=1 Tax=Streptomyces gobiensis TaxID=2875706 RepID=UPI001E2DC6C5|nr:ATP-binding protein [Streptomyces gobiensis]UGY92484.1 ATP-binding protein [Streptomyces gobiensis]
MSIWWSLHLRREAASVPFARRLLLGTMETAGVEPDIAYELSVALSEACANAVEHGGEEGGSDGYRVSAYLNGDMCRIEVTDHGPGFPDGHHGRPMLLADSPQTECGRGLYLIEALADHVRFRNRPGDGAVVTFDKILKWRDDALLKAS